MRFLADIFDRLWLMSLAILWDFGIMEYISLTFSN